ncbi:MAG: hypothetical protein Q3Y17_09475 [Blautia sp.]|nr:hypothetical protein [uncultured Blautia sp.]MDR3892854.1 hypothetical protein [Blautia sp.]
MGRFVENNVTVREIGALGALVVGKYFADGWEFWGTECERMWL